MRVVALVRHGEEDGIADGVYASRSDRPLSARGRKQAEAAAEFLAPLSTAGVVSSPVPRARETAETIARGRPVTLLEGLVGLDLGEWEGISAQSSGQLAETVQRHGGRPPGGETLAEVLERASSALRQVLQTAENAIAVAHRMTIAVLLADALGMPLERTSLIQQSPGGVSILIEQPGRKLIPGFLNISPDDPMRLGLRELYVL